MTQRWWYGDRAASEERNTKGLKEKWVQRILTAGLHLTAESPPCWSTAQLRPVLFQPHTRVMHRGFGGARSWALHCHPADQVTGDGGSMVRGAGMCGRGLPSAPGHGQAPSSLVANVMGCSYLTIATYGKEGDSVRGQGSSTLSNLGCI